MFGGFLTLCKYCGRFYRPWMDHDCQPTAVGRNAMARELREDLDQIPTTEGEEDGG